MLIYYRREGWLVLGFLSLSFCEDAWIGYRQPLFIGFCYGCAAKWCSSLHVLTVPYIRYQGNVLKTTSTIVFSWQVKYEYQRGSLFFWQSIYPDKNAKPHHRALTALYNYSIRPPPNYAAACSQLSFCGPCLQSAPSFPAAARVSWRPLRCFQTLPGPAARVSCV